jgi:hypothetical protein
MYVNYQIIILHIQKLLHLSMKNLDRPRLATEPLSLIIHMKLIIRLINKLIVKGLRKIFFFEIIFLFLFLFSFFFFLFSFAYLICIDL